MTNYDYALLMERGSTLLLFMYFVLNFASDL